MNSIKVILTDGEEVYDIKHIDSLEELIVLNQQEYMETDGFLTWKVASK